MTSGPVASYAFWVFCLIQVNVLTLSGQLCKRTGEMFYTADLKMALLNWSCRALAPVAPVQLWLWRVASKTCYSFMYLRLNRWNRFVVFLSFDFRTLLIFKMLILTSWFIFHVQHLSCKELLCVSSRWRRRRRLLKSEPLKSYTFLSLPATDFNASNSCNKMCLIAQLCERNSHHYQFRCNLVCVVSQLFVFLGVFCTVTVFNKNSPVTGTADCNNLLLHICQARKAAF